MYRDTGAGAQYLSASTAQTDGAGRFVRVLVLGPIGLQQCLLRIVVTPPAGSGLSPKSDSVVAKISKVFPPLDTAAVSFALRP